MPAGKPNMTISGGPYEDQPLVQTPKGGVSKGPKNWDDAELTGKGKAEAVGYYNVDANPDNSVPEKGGPMTISKGPKNYRPTKKFNAE